MSYFIYTDIISSLLDPRLADPGSTLIHVGAYGPYNILSKNKKVLFTKQITLLHWKLGNV